MTLKEQIVTEIMSLVRRQPQKMDPKPTIEELEKILSSECTDAISIEPDGSVCARPTSTTVGAVADKVVTVVEAAIKRRDDALKFCHDMAEEELPHAKVGSGAEVVLRHIVRRVHETL